MHFFGQTKNFKRESFDTVRWTIALFSDKKWHLTGSNVKKKSFIYMAFLSFDWQKECMGRG